MATPRPRRTRAPNKRFFSPVPQGQTPTIGRQTKRGNRNRTPLVDTNDAALNARQQEKVAVESNVESNRTIGSFQQPLEDATENADGTPKVTRKTNSYFAYQKQMKSPFLALNPGMTFGQRSKYTSLRYSEEHSGDNTGEDDVVPDQCIPEFDCLSLSKLVNKSFYDVKQILVFAFKYETSIQKQWWSLEQLVGMVNRLNEISKTSALAWKSKLSVRQVVTRLRKCYALVAQTEKDYSNSTKKIFMRSMKVANRNCTAVYLDLSDGIKTIEYAIQDLHCWFDDLGWKRLSIKAFVPLSVYELINPWYSTELERFFGARDGETAREAAEKLHLILDEAQKSTSGTKKYTDGLQEGKLIYYLDGLGTEDGPLELEMDPTKVEKLVMRNKEMAVYMRKALSVALGLDAENEPFSFKRCCDVAVSEIQACLNDGRLNPETGGRTVLDWFRDFKKARLFQNPLLEERHGVPFFLNNPRSVQRIKAFGNNNLSKLTISLVQDFILNDEIPRLIEEYRSNEQRELTKEMILNESGIKVLCLSTVHKWMKYLGFKRGVYKKSFYTDNHERPDVVAHRIDYCIENCKLEIRSYVWVQLLPDRVAQLKEDGRIMEMNNGYRVSKEDGVVYFEYHVADVKDGYNLKELAGCTRFGANLSMRKAPGDCPVMMWGQDEVVSHEKQQSAMTWFGSEGQAPPRPKDKGAGYHISGIKSREVGWMPVITQAELDEINASRVGKRYVAEAAAIAVLGSAEKQPFTMETYEQFTFRWGLHIGVNNEGYWTNQHALIQYENCADVKRVLYPHVLHVDYYDHSQGHMAKRINGLDVSRMNKSHGGSQPHMRSTSIVDESCLGPFAGKGLSVGDPFHCVFQPGDNGPVMLDPEKRQSLKYDRVFPGETSKKTLRSKDEIYNHLKAKLDRSKLCKLPAEGQLNNTVSLASLKQIASDEGIDLSIQVPKKQVGWVGQPKGAYQICYERGLIDHTLGYSFYTMDGRKDEAGNLIPGSSLRLLLESCCDFKNEMTMLEWVASEYNCKVLFSPKCHPEIAGVGIEYDWGHAKNTLNRIPLCDRKGVAKFIDVILNQCFSRDNLSNAIIRANARQARAYIVAYLMMHAAIAASNMSSDKDGSNEFAVGSITMDALKGSVTHIASSNINAAKKIYKRHRGVALFDLQGGAVDFIIPKQEFDSVKNASKPVVDDGVSNH